MLQGVPVILMEPLGAGSHIELNNKINNKYKIYINLWWYII